MSEQNINFNAELKTVAKVLFDMIGFFSFYS